MIYLFYGPDSYRRNQKFRTTIAEYRSKHPVSDMAVFDLEEEPENWVKARDFLNQPSMFVDSKVLVVKESGAVPAAGGQKEWIKVLKANLETPRAFILLSDSKKPLKALEFLEKPPARAQFFGELEGRLLEVFLKNEAAKLGLDFEKEAWDYLLGCLTGVEERSWVAINELERMALSGFRQPIELKSLKEVISPVLNDEVFGAAREMMWSRNWADRAKTLEKLLLQRKEPAYIFNSLAYLAKGRELIRFADYDAAIKGGGMDYEEALTDFALTS
jgi:DNA polymerase III delta subunit